MSVNLGKQKTIEKETVYSGKTLHSGENTEVRFKPADPDTGIVFHRLDRDPAVKIKAVPTSVVSTERCTVLGKKYRGKLIKAATVEHLLSALWGLGIDNIIIELKGSEVPIGDGSAAPFYDLLKKSGITGQKADKNIIEIKQSLWVRENQERFLAVFPYNGFKASFIFDYDHPQIGTQFMEFEKNIDSYVDKLARARTFGFKENIEQLHNNDIALGGSLNNVLLYDSESSVNGSRFDNEPVRHKLLDLIGDIALCGELQGHLLAVRSGHSLNVKLAQQIYKLYG